MMAQHIHECWLGSFVSFSIAKKPFSYIIFKGGGGSDRLPPTPSGSTHRESMVLLN